MHPYTRKLALVVLVAACGGGGATGTNVSATERQSGLPEDPWSVPEEYRARPISTEAGEAYFAEYGVGDPYGAGIAYPIFRGLMKLYPEELGSDFAGFSERFGTIASLAHPGDPDAIPLGFHRTTDPNTRVDFLVVNCQICHAGRVPGPDGEQVVTGLGNRRIRIHAYARAFARITKPHRRQMDAGTLDEELSKELHAEIYAEAIVVGWRGINKRETDEPIPFNKVEVVKFLLAVPEVFQIIKNSAESMDTFRQEEIEEEAQVLGNS